MNRSVAILVCMILTAVSAHSQSAGIPIDQQLPLLVKVLLFDKQVHEEKSEYVIGIIFQHSVEESKAMNTDILMLNDSLQLTLSNGVPVRFVPINIDEVNKWKHEVYDRGVSAFIVTPLQKNHLSAIADYCREHRIISMSTVPEFVDEGLAYGLSQSNGRRVILINLPESVSQGAQFSSQILRIAKVLR
jgi:hypothetical protein